MLICPGKHSCLIQCDQALQGYISTEGLAEAGCEQLDLVPLHDARIAAGECHELLVVVIHRALVAEKSQVTHRRVGEWWAEANVDQLDEARPCQKATIEFKPMELELGIIK
jgi:hypothetical protein